MTWVNKEELIERAYDEEKGMSKPYHDTFGVTVEWLADKTTTMNEAEHVRHGHWIPVLISTGVSAFGVDEMTVEEEKCSVCGKTYWVGVEKNFCPNCGAKMDETKVE